MAVSKTDVLLLGIFTAFLGGLGAVLLFTEITKPKQVSAQGCRGCRGY